MFGISVERIVLKGRNADNEYEITRSFLCPVPEDIQKEQLSVIDKMILRKSSGCDFPSKDSENDPEPSPSSVQDSAEDIPATSIIEETKPGLDDDEEYKMEDFVEVIYPKGEAIKKYEASHPYNFFLTAVEHSPPTHGETLSITMQEILDNSLGELESSVQINFEVDIDWLLDHYYFAGHL